MVIPGFSDYNIEKDGVVTRISTGVVVEPHIVDCKGIKYIRVSLHCSDGCMRAYNVLTLLAITYLGKRAADGLIVTAKDGNNLNAVLDNVICSTQSELIKKAWRDGKYISRTKKGRSYNDDSIEMLYDVLQAYDKPVTMTQLSSDLHVPYATIRYSMIALRDAGKVRKTDRGFEVIL